MDKTFIRVGYIKHMRNKSATKASAFVEPTPKIHKHRLHSELMQQVNNKSIDICGADT